MLFSFFFELFIWLIVTIPLLMAIAYFTLVESKILGSIQSRRGPNVMGIFGLLQPLSDGFKLLVKEMLLPSSSNKILFLMAPFLTFVLSLMNWVIIPMNPFSIPFHNSLSLLFIFAVSSLGVYGILIAGWASNSKYALLGSLSSAAQMMSYEISMGFTLCSLFIMAGSLELMSIVEMQEGVWFFYPLFPLFLIFFTSALAETNSHPFDLPEAEAELVSGYNVEYSAMNFALFSLGEYSNMLVMSALNTLFFFGGWLPPKLLSSFFISFFHFFSVTNFLMTEVFLYSICFSFKICFFVAAYVIMRAALPRYRYDQLMELGWKIFLPLSLAYVILTVSIMYLFNLS